MFKHLIDILFAPGDELLDQVLEPFESRQTSSSRWAQDIDPKLLIGARSDLALAAQPCGRFDRLRGQGF